MARKRRAVGRMINGIVFGLSTPDRHKHRSNIQDILKDVAPRRVPKGTLQVTGKNQTIKEFVEQAGNITLQPYQERLLEAVSKRKKNHV
jgi:hypothetical protein